jgi:hypothetical protein
VTPAVFFLLSSVSAVYRLQLIILGQSFSHAASLFSLHPHLSRYEPTFRAFLFCLGNELVTRLAIPSCVKLLASCLGGIRADC